MIYLVLILTTSLQIYFAKKRHVIFSIVVPFIFAVIYTLVEVVVWSNPLIWVSIGILAYHAFIYFLAWKYFGAQEKKLNETRKVDLKEL